MKGKFWYWVVVLLVGLFLPAICFADGTWEKVLAEPVSVEFNGESRLISPGCAIPTEDNPEAGYAFYFKPGKTDKLMVLFNGGGACWNTETCVDSLLSGSPTYFPALSIPDNDPSNWGGILDLENADNPYRDWSILFLPYCTGDIHVGSNDQSYETEAGSTVIHHRGFDNFLYAKEWLSQRYSNTIEQVGKVFIAGSSAGAYGAAFNYPHVKAMFPNAKGFLLADAGNGILAEGFSEAAMHGLNSTWKIDANLPYWVPGMETLPLLSADNYFVGVYSNLASYYDKDRFGAYTTAWDAIQVMFYNIMLNPSDPAMWVDGNALLSAYQTWPVLMQSFASQLDSFDNYSFYIAPGCEHTVLRNDKFYTKEVAGVPFLNWVQGLSGKKAYRDDWRSLIDAGLPPSPEDIAMCLGQ